MRDVDGVLLDLLMAVMNSLAAWSGAAGVPDVGLAWRDAVTARIIASPRYVPYEELVADAAVELGLAPGAPAELLDRWQRMEPWPDAAAIADLPMPFGFVTNSSTNLAAIAAARSGLNPRFRLSAEEIGWYKPHPEAYREGCRRLGTVPERTVFVAGAPYDAEGARRAGFRTFLVNRRPDHRAPHASVRTARSLTEIAAAITDPDGRAGT